MTQTTLTVFDSQNKNAIIEFIISGVNTKGASWIGCYDTFWYKYINSQGFYFCFYSIKKKLALDVIKEINERLSEGVTIEIFAENETNLAFHINITPTLYTSFVERKLCYFLHHILRMCSMGEQWSYKLDSYDVWNKSALQFICKINNESSDTIRRLSEDRIEEDNFIFYKEFMNRHLSISKIEKQTSFLRKLKNSHTFNSEEIIQELATRFINLRSYLIGSVTTKPNNYSNFLIYEYIIDMQPSHIYTRATTYQGVKRAFERAIAKNPELLFESPSYHIKTIHFFARNNNESIDTVNKSLSTSYLSNTEIEDKTLSIDYNVSQIFRNNFWSFRDTIGEDKYIIRTKLIKRQLTTSKLLEYFNLKKENSWR